MAITEENRHQLYAKLEEVLGHDPATTMMEHLPPVGWADVATKRDLDAHQAATKSDLDALEARIDLRFQEFEARIDLRFQEFEARIDLRFQELEARIDLRFEASEARIDAKLERAMRVQFRNVVAANAVLLTSFIALDRLFGG